MTAPRTPVPDGLVPRTILHWRVRMVLPVVVEPAYARRQPTGGATTSASVGWAGEGGRIEGDPGRAGVEVDVGGLRAGACVGHRGVNV